MNVEFHFDFGSPNAYLSHLVIPAIESRTGIIFQYKPVLLGGVFKATDNASPAVALQGRKNKSEYQRIETLRFLSRYQITKFQHNSHFPVNTLQIMRGAVLAQSKDYFKQYVDDVFRHMWCEPEKMDELDIIKSALASSKLDVIELLEGMQNPDITQALMDNTTRSVEMGAFGSPPFFVENEIFLGKDKLVDVEEESGRRK